MSGSRSDFSHEDASGGQRLASAVKLFNSLRTDPKSIDEEEVKEEAEEKKKKEKEEEKEEEEEVRLTNDQNDFMNLCQPLGLFKAWSADKKEGEPRKKNKEWFYLAVFLAFFFYFSKNGFGGNANVDPVAQ